jgi:hypothetical protein
VRATAVFAHLRFDPRTAHANWRPTPASRASYHLLRRQYRSRPAALLRADNSSAKFLIKPRFEFVPGNC